MDIEQRMHDLHLLQLNRFLCCLYHVHAFPMCMIVPCACLYHVHICTICMFVSCACLPCGCLYHVHVCTMYMFVPCLCLYHVYVCTMFIFVPCLCLYHVHVCTMCNVHVCTVYMLVPVIFYLEFRAFHIKYEKFVQLKIAKIFVAQLKCRKSRFIFTDLKYSMKARIEN